MFLPGDHQLDFFESTLRESLGERLGVIGYRMLAGGDINTVVLLSTSEGSYVIKYHEGGPAGMLAAEARGLALLADTATVRLPRVLGHGQDGAGGGLGGPVEWLLLEHIEANERRDRAFWARLGQGLAELHGHTQAHCGLSFDNYIGSLPQANVGTAGLPGPEFFAQYRILPQAGRALVEGLISPSLYGRIEGLCGRLGDLLPAERPALVHGDLWSGNLLTARDGAPVLIDPAPYYGPREAELAFTQLFGGFEDWFLEVYQEFFPLEPGFIDRVPLYNLYPLLVHVNLFSGGGYVGALERTIARYVPR